MNDNNKADGTESTRTPGYKKQSYLRRVAESASGSINAIQALIDGSPVLAEGINHYSRILSDLVFEVPSGDHPLLYLLLMHYAEALERLHPGTKTVAKAIDRMFETDEICISVPILGGKEDSK